MRVDVIDGGEGVKDNVHWTLSAAMVEFRLSPLSIKEGIKHFYGLESTAGTKNG